MRIVITADLHYRPSQRETYLAFARWVEAQRPDCFIIAGDTGHPLRLFERALQLFADLTCPKLLLAGNHDVYRGEHDSRSLWETLLPQATLDAGFVWLEDTVVRLGALGIAGSMAWYDYSSRSGHLPQGDAELRLLKAVVNHDADFIDWPWSDVTIARFLARRFAARLDSLVSDPGVNQILVATHMPIFRECVPEYPSSEIWSLLRAYMGNFSLGEMVRNTPKVTHVLSGHIHRRGRWTVPGAHGSIDVQLVGSEAGAPRAIILDL
ncbi:MAG: metallophosphoesterase [Anaerolineae bacterium]|nr:metallophosphoesterase [Caldilinea sp.]MCB0232133.1 metallophosphoesterase [Anaerolineae bacterium]MCB0245515.1 metallophosphoesterase [Anaerolineae bacterium]